MMDQAKPQSGAITGTGPRGAKWLIGAFYIFAIVLLTGWGEGWWQNAPHADGPSPMAAQRTHAGG